MRSAVFINHSGCSFQVLISNFIRKLAPYDWLLLGVSAPVCLYADRFPPLVVSLALLILLLTWFSRFVATRHFITRSPLDVPILCLLLTVPLSLYASANFASSLPKLTGLLFGIAAYYVLVRFSADQQNLPIVLGVWLASVLGIALLGLIGIDWVSVKAPLLNQLTSRLPRLVVGLGTRAGRGLHPNEVAGALALTIAPLVNALWRGRDPSANDASAQSSPKADWRARAQIWLDPDRRSGQIVWMATLILAGGVLLLTQSRSALFGVAVALVLMGAIRSQVLRWLAVIGLAGSLVAVAAVGPGRIGEILLGTGGVSAVGSLDFAGRQEVWSRALYAIQDFPFTGVGLNQFEHVVKSLYPLFMEGPDADVPHAHDIYLQVAMDFGLGGLVAYIAMLALAALMSVRVYRALPASLSRRLALGFACGLLAHQLYGLTDAVTLGAKPSVEWWLTLGLVSCLYLGAWPASKPPLVQWHISPFELLMLWLLGSLIAIANVGDNALLGVALAILAGCALGLGALVQFEGTGDREQVTEQRPKP